MAIRKIKTKTKGTRYAARVHTGNGRYKLLEPRAAKEAAREDEAKWILDRRERDRTRGGEFIDFYLEGYAERVKDSTLHHAKAGLACWRKEFGSRTLRSIDAQEAEEWARANRWAVPPVVTMFNYAVKRGQLDRNVFSGLKRRGPGRKHETPLSVAEVDKLADVAGREHGEWLRAFILFAAYTGMRVGELFALTWADIDFGRNRVMVKRRLYRGQLGLPKNNRTREVVLFPEARDALLLLDRSSEWVFVGKRGDQMSQSKLTYYWQKIEGGFGRKVTPHALRHFCGHHLYVTQKMRDFLVAEQLGHTDGGTLIRDLYGHGDHGALEEIEKLYTAGATENVIPIDRKAANDG